MASLSSAHPHSRGANVFVTCACHAMAYGSSPHTWGVFSRGTGRRSSSTVHPHSRGAYPGSPCLWTSPWRFIPTHVGRMVTYRALPWSPHGSSPHTWGVCIQVMLHKHLRSVHPHTRGAYECLDDLCFFLGRFIPTHVGRMVTLRRLCRSGPRVHPHTRGAYAWTIPSVRSSRSVHPTHLGRMVSTSITHLSFTRFIPTHVGRILLCHPPPLLLLRFIPTHVGRIDFGFLVLRGVRFIPTHVGRMNTKDQPRTCVFGSSPHMWGVCFDRDSVVFQYCRFIPTHVGRIRSAPAGSGPQSVHPHTCGAYVLPWPRLRLS